MKAKIGDNSVNLRADRELGWNHSSEVHVTRVTELRDHQQGL